MRNRRLVAHTLCSLALGIMTLTLPSRATAASPRGACEVCGSWDACGYTEPAQWEDEVCIARYGPDSFSYGCAPGECDDFPGYDQVVCSC
jgi:hypothetical protein